MKRAQPNGMQRAQHTTWTAPAPARSKQSKDPTGSAQTRNPATLALCQRAPRKTWCSQCAPWEKSEPSPSQLSSLSPRHPVVSLGLKTRAGGAGGGVRGGCLGLAPGSMCIRRCRAAGKSGRIFLKFCIHKAGETRNRRFSFIKRGQGTEPDGGI